MVEGARQHRITEVVQLDGLQVFSNPFEQACRVWIRYQAPCLIDNHGPTAASDLEAGEEGAQLLQVDVQPKHATDLAVVRDDGQGSSHPRLLVGEKDIDVAPVQLPVADGATIPGTPPRIVVIVFSALHRDDLALEVPAAPGYSGCGVRTLDAFGVDGSVGHPFRHQEVALGVSNVDRHQLRVILEDVHG